MAGMLEGKIAIVTGAGGGIRREIAIAMARAGAKVVINDIGASLAGEGQSATPAEETKQLIEQGGGAGRHQHQFRRRICLCPEDRSGCTRPFRRARHSRQQCRRAA